MASARLAQLLEQRKAARGLQFGNARRVLSPSNNSVASIAKRTATGELDAMVSQYNSGLVTNEDMRAFLLKMQTNPGIVGQDKIEIDTQIRDFDARVEKDKLEATFKAAPENTLAQYQAVQALVSYHQNRAGSMAAGTPAQSQALENAATWQQKAKDVQTTMATTARRNLRYSEEQKINQLPNSSAERSYAKAQMYKQLYEQANADGDPTDANKYAAYYQQELTNAEQQALQETEQSDREATQAEKNDLRGILGSLQNDYHDGRINENQYLQALYEISPRIDATNDYGLINTLNRTTDIVYKNQSKGGLKRSTTASGLPVVTGKGKGGAGGGSQTDWDTEDFTYSDNLKFLTEKLNKGEMDGKTYSQAMADIVEIRNAELEKRIETVHATASENPNAKIMYNGKKTRAADVLESLYTEQEGISSQYDAVQSGKFGLIMVEPSQFSTSGDVTKKGKSQASIQIIDTRNLPKGRYKQDSDGIFHEIQRERVFLQPEQLTNVVGNVYTDENGTTFYIKTDQSGNPYIEKGQFVNIYEPGSANAIRVSLDDPNSQVDPNTGVRYVSDEKDAEGNQIVKSYDQISQEHKGALMKGLETARELKNPKSALSQAKMLEEQKKVKQEKVEGGGLLQQIATKSMIPDPLGTIKTAVDTGKTIMNAAKPITDTVTKAVGSVNEAVDQVALPKVVAAAARPKPAAEVGITQNTPIKLPELRVPQASQPAQQVKLPTLKVVGQVAPTPVQTMMKQTGTKVSVAAPPKIQGLPTKVGPQDFSIASSINALKNNTLKAVKGLFGIK